MIVTIDGPAGAGKSSAARGLAARLGYRFIDTGAMYRAVALALLENHWEQLPAAEAARHTSQLRLDLDGADIQLDGRDVSAEIRSQRVTQATRLAADNPHIREQLVHRQRELAAAGRVVTEGRDQGTVAFPDADCKIFLTASPEERARRRQIELLGRGVELSSEEVLDQINERDQQDEQRDIGRLTQAEDAELVLTDGLSLDEVINRLEQAVRKCQAN